MDVGKKEKFPIRVVVGRSKRKPDGGGRGVLPKDLETVAKAVGAARGKDPKKVTLLDAASILADLAEDPFSLFRCL